MGLRNRFLNVAPMARSTAPTIDVISVPLDSARGRPLLEATRPPNHDDCGADQERKGRGQERLPRERENLVDADADEAPADPRDEQEDEHRLQEEPHRAEILGTRS